MSPSTNTFFTASTGYSGEQNLIDDLVIEQIGMFGIDLLYMPRENINLDKLLHESTQDVFELALSIPMYIKSYEGYTNGIEMLTKFGVRSSDELTLIMSRSQWTTYYAPYVKSFYNAQNQTSAVSVNDPLEGQTSRRPKEGDLIFFPYDGGIFEIKYVMFDQPFFQLGKGYIYELQCEKFEYSGENFSTGVEQVDSVVERNQFYSLELQLKEGGESTFQFQEKVRIFDLTSTEYNKIELENGALLIITEDSVNVTTADSGDVIDFKLYDDAGLLRTVPHVEGTVSFWNQPERKLHVTDLSDLNPDQLNTETYDVDINNFDTVLVVGQTSGAIWTSIDADATPKAFDDSREIEKEFSQIKVYDPYDDNPFGFY